MSRSPVGLERFGREDYGLVSREVCQQWRERRLGFDDHRRRVVGLETGDRDVGERRGVGRSPEGVDRRRRVDGLAVVKRDVFAEVELPLAVVDPLPVGRQTWFRIGVVIDADQRFGDAESSEQAPAVERIPVRFPRAADPEVCAVVGTRETAGECEGARPRQRVQDGSSVRRRGSVGRDSSVDVVDFVCHSYIVEVVSPAVPPCTSHAGFGTFAVRDELVSVASASPADRWLSSDRHSPA